MVFGCRLTYPFFDRLFDYIINYAYSNLTKYMYIHQTIFRITESSQLGEKDT